MAFYHSNQKVTDIWVSLFILAFHIELSKNSNFMRANRYEVLIFTDMVILLNNALSKMLLSHFILPTSQYGRCSNCLTNDTFEA